MSLLSANAVPLPDVLPWADALLPQRTVLINDSVGTDGRFLLHQQIVVGGAAGGAWERNLVELADGIVDVMPLQSGFSLEAHGRLVFTERKGGRGWRDAASSAAGGRRLPSTARPTSSSAAGAPAFLTTVNYCCEDSSIKAFRLRSSVS